MGEVPERLPFTLHTHTGSPTGYAETATALFRGLIEEGVEVHYICIADDVIYETPSYDLLVNKLREVEPEGEPVQVVYSIAPVFHANSGEYKVGFSMIEVDRICPRWVRACNRMDEIWVPTHQNKVAFVASGVQSLIRVVPLCINTEQFSPRFLPAVYHGEHKFRFICSAWWQKRKRWDLLMIAFAEEFGNEKEVGLICKTMSEEDISSLGTQIHGWVGTRLDDQIALVEGAYPWWEYAMMLRSAHAFVLPTAGEGWGCPPVQALACGLPVIVTDAQGTGEVLRDARGAPLPGVRFIKAELAPTEVEHEYYAGSNWWVPDKDDLRAAMREVYEDWQTWKAAAMIGADIVRETLGHRAAGRAFKGELERIYREVL